MNIKQCEGFFNELVINLYLEINPLKVCPCFHAKSSLSLFIVDKHFYFNFYGLSVDGFGLGGICIYMNYLEDETQA